MVFKLNGIKYQNLNLVFPTEKEFVYAIPEPNNIFDSNAVGIYNKYHQRVGYAPINGNSIKLNQLKWFDG